MNKAIKVEATEKDFKLGVIIDALDEIAEKLQSLANHLQYLRKLAQSVKGEKHEQSH